MYVQYVEDMLKRCLIKCIVVEDCSWNVFCTIFCLGFYLISTLFGDGARSNNKATQPKISQRQSNVELSSQSLKFRFIRSVTTCNLHQTTITLLVLLPQFKRNFGLSNHRMKSTRSDRQRMMMQYKVGLYFFVTNLIRNNSKFTSR